MVDAKWTCAIGVIALIFTTGCPDSTPATGGTGGTGTPAPAATITIGAAGVCTGGDISITDGPKWVPVTGASQLTMTVCIKCPDPTGTLVGVTGATVTGEVNEEFSSASRVSVTGKTGPDGCVRLTRRIANSVKALLSGKAYAVNLQDASGNPLFSQVITIP